MHRLVLLALLLSSTRLLEFSEGHLIDGIFTEPTLEPGYNLVATVPRGALALNVTELRHTQNYLAIRLQDGSYLFNGNYSINWSGEYEGAGTTFLYIRQSSQNLESFSAAGPLRESVDVMVFYQEPNPGIVYRYIVPGSGRTSGNPHVVYNTIPEKHLDPNAVSHKRIDASNGTLIAFSRSPTSTTPQHFPRRYKKRKFNWKANGYTECSKSCGGGSQSFRYICIRENTQAQVPDKRCHAVEKPREIRLRCNVRPCPPTWRFGPWSECSVTCGSGFRERKAECVQEVRAALTMVLAEGACMEEKSGALKEVCTMRACENEFRSTQTTIEVPQWSASPWTKCSATCGPGKITRTVSCVTQGLPCDPENKPSALEECNFGPCPSISNAIFDTSHVSQWLHTDWSDKCSAECGSGVQTRRTFCYKNDEDGSCEDKDRPESWRACSSNKTCSGQWFTGPWTECSSECGVGEQIREVVCVTTLRGALRLVLDMNCPAVKPETKRACQAAPCTSTWFISDWTECSRSCGKGLQKREVVCLTADGLPPEHHQNHCREEDRPVSRRMCNDYPCKDDARATENNNRATQVQNDLEISNGLEDNPHCKDIISNCNLVIQARLCAYPYYQQSCCLSCAKAKLPID